MIAYECSSDVLETKQIIKFSIKDYFSKCEQIRSFLRFWSHLLKKPIMENLIFFAVWDPLQAHNQYLDIFVNFFQASWEQ